MSSTSIISIIVIIVAVILVDVFCGDVTNTRQTSLRQITQNSGQKSPEISSDGKSTTPWPVLGHRRTQNPNLNGDIPQPSKGPTVGPKKWIQQNNIWIRNEQAASGSDMVSHNSNSNGQNARGTVRQNLGVENVNLGGNRQNPGDPQQNSGVANVNNQRGTTRTNVNSQIHQSNRQQALIDGLGGNKQNLEGQQPNINNKGNTEINTNPQIHQSNRQNALINGLRGNQQNLGRVNTSSLIQNVNNKPLGPPSAPSSTQKSSINPETLPNKPISYASVVGPKIPTPVSPTNPKIPLVTPLSPQPVSPKKDAIPSTGPTGNESFDDNQNTKFSDGDATDDELREFSEMLLRKDSNNAMKYVTLNLQGMTSSRSANDEAPEPLLKIEPDAYKIPSVEKMLLLYNNYFLDAGQNEVYTGAERIEENNLLDTMLATPVMQFARSFLIQKGKLGKDPKEFKDLLRLIWFNMYSRGQGRIGSSGFEHIFLAEIKNNQVSGLHNWVYFNEEESQKRANYLGYLKKLDLGEKGAILKYHFTFHDIDKPVGSMFIGTSPELEMAVYSTCFVLRADKICPLKMNGNKFIIRTYTYRYRGKNMIGSAFPEI